jgi:hypothetical protein
MSKFKSKRSSDIRSISNVIKNKHRELEAINKVKQTAIGFKVKDGKMLRDTVSIIIYVRWKPKPTALRASNIEPIPKEIDGVPTDIVEIPPGFEKRILRSTRLTTVLPDDAKHRPFSGGTAVINATANPPGTGTLGLIVGKASGDTKGLYGITNNHVGANEMVQGHPPTARKGDPWTQPGYHGGGEDPRDTVATLDSWGDMIPEDKGVNYYDFSLGEISSGSMSDARSHEVMEVGRVEEMEDVTLGDKVVKRGRTTGKTIGEVTAVGTEENSVLIPYQGKYCALVENIQITGIPEEIPFSTGGDSGSIIATFDEPHRAVALLYGGSMGSDGIDRTLASPIRRIADDFKLDI